MNLKIGLYVVELVAYIQTMSGDGVCQTPPIRSCVRCLGYKQAAFFLKASLLLPAAIDDSS